MLGLISVVILSGSLNLSIISDLNSSQLTIETPTHAVSELLDNYYEEYEHQIFHGAKCNCGSDQPNNKDLLGQYYSEFLNLE